MWGIENESSTTQNSNQIKSDNIKKGRGREQFVFYFSVFPLVFVSFSFFSIPSHFCVFLLWRLCLVGEHGFLRYLEKRYWSYSLCDTVISEPTYIDWSIVPGGEGWGGMTHPLDLCDQLLRMLYFYLKYLLTQNINCKPQILQFFVLERNALWFWRNDETTPKEPTRQERACKSGRFPFYFHNKNQNYRKWIIAV